MHRGRTLFFKTQPKIVATATVAGPKECAGVIGAYTDIALRDDMFGEDTFERAERKMLLTAVQKSIRRAGFTEADIDLFVQAAEDTLAAL